MECLDANAVQDLMSGALDPRARSEAAVHLDGCEDCRSLLSQLAKDATRDAAHATLGKTDLGLRDTEGQPLVKMLATVGSSNLPTERPTPDPLGVTADVSLLRQSGQRQIGKMFGKYTLVDRIGAGAMGVVYRADDPSLNRRVALKLLHKPDEALAIRLVREAQSMAQVNHPNVVQVYDAGISDGSTYIAMELVVGSSLRVWQQEKRSAPEIIEAYLAAGRGLAAAHDAGIIHRDFKPDNCLVGGDGRVRVTDFGLASARPSEGGDAPEELELTNSGMVLGTPAYMAPEQFTGGNVDPRTDQFNYCVALYEALYGARPFKGKSFDELGDNVCDGKVRPAPAGSRVSRALRGILMRGLAVRPGDRYPTMDHLLDDLGRDRARAWRRTAVVSAALALTLGLGLGADFVVRDRVSSSNSQSFDATGRQIDRAFGVVAERFDANANQMYYQAAINDVRSYRDEQDFGLGDAGSDRKRLIEIHDTLASQDWSLWKMSGSQSLSVSIGDYKGRLLFTNVPDAGRVWGEKDAIPDLLQVDWIKNIFEGTEKTMVLQRTDDKHVKAALLLGKNPGYALAFCFARVMVGSGETKEISGALIQAVNAEVLIPDIRLDKDMLLSIVSVDGAVHVGQVPPALIAAARDDGVVEVDYEGKPYQVKRQALRNLEQRFEDANSKVDNPGLSDHKPVGYVVMAQELTSVLSGLFPTARLVFALLALGALAVAVGTTLRARQLAR